MFLQHGSILSHFTLNTPKNNETTYPPKIAKAFVITGFSALSVLAIECSSNAASITTFSNRVTFDSAVGATTLEDFTNRFNFPIPNGTLSSTTSFGTLSAGDIKAGAIYTTPVGSGNYFNIDAGGDFVGGFLDGFNPSTRDLTITYSPLISAFGFDTNSFMPNFDITINFLSGLGYTANFAGITGTQFFGFQSDAADIQSVIISGNNSGLAFAIDNHAFGGSAVATSVPEPFTVLGTIFSAGYGVALKRKLAKAQADKEDVS